MTNGYYDIQPTNVTVGTTTTPAVKATFNTSYTPFATSMLFNWAIYSVDGRTLYTGMGEIDETLLSMWGENDDYIINVMATMAGLVVIW